MPATKKRNVAKDVSKYRGQSGGLTRAINKGQRVPDGALAQSKENLRVATLVSHIAKIVDAAPPLTDKQREKLAALLRAP